MATSDLLAATSMQGKVLVSQALPTAEAAVYTVPANTGAILRQGSLTNVTSLTAAPVLAAASVAGSGGSFGAGTYRWVVTAMSADGGETLISNEVSAAVAANGTATLSWSAVQGAVTYRLYRGTASGGPYSLVGATSNLSTIDAGSATGVTPSPAASTFGSTVVVHLSLVQSGGTIGDGTHRILNAYKLAANETLSLADLLSGHSLGPGDKLAGFASAASAVDIVVSGTVNS